MDTSLTVPALASTDPLAQIDEYTVALRKAVTLPRTGRIIGANDNVTTAGSWASLTGGALKITIPETWGPGFGHTLDVLVHWSFWAVLTASDLRGAVQVLGRDGITQIVNEGAVAEQTYAPVSGTWGSSRLLSISSSDLPCTVELRAFRASGTAANMRYPHLIVAPLRWIRAGASL